ncbi:MAG: hypothetical protein V5A55_13335 [Halovenus sp.]
MSDDAPTDDHEEHSDSTPASGFSRRSLLALGALGFGGLTAGSGVVAGDSSEPRPWKQDVDAQGYDLMDLGSVSMSANSTAITDFEGNNLEIDSGTLTTEIDDFAGDNLSVDSGVLNADPPWEDTDSDGLLETPDYDGIDITDAEIQNLSETYYTSTFGDDGQAIHDAMAETDGDSWARIVIDPIESAPYMVENPPVEVPSKTVVDVREHVKLGAEVLENMFQNENFADDAVDDEEIHFVGNGGKLDGNRENQLGRNADVGPRASGFHRNPITIAGVDGCSVRNLTIVESIFHGVATPAVNGFLCTGCDLRNHNQRGVLVHWRTTDERSQFNVRVVDNYLSNTGAGGIAGGIGFSSGQNVVCANNTIEDSLLPIGAGPGDAGVIADNMVIANNTILNGRDRAIACSPRGGEDNKGMAIVGNTIKCTENTCEGIFIGNSGDGLNNISISDNSIRTSGAPITIFGEAGVTMENISIGNNVFTAGIDTRKGIQLIDVENITITGNVAYECGVGGGILVWGREKPASDILIANNHCRDNGRGDNIPQNCGIHLRGEVVDSTVIGNRCTDTGSGLQRVGIFSSSACENIVYLSNDLRGNVDTGHDLNGSGRITDPVNQDTTEDYNIT